MGLGAGTGDANPPTVPQRTRGNRWRWSLDGSAGSGAELGQPAGPNQRALQDAVRFLIDSIEGGAKLIRDQGGLTRYGISQRAFPREDIANLTRERAEELYREHYWKPIHGDALPGALALVVFDGAVNHGVAQAVKLLQRELRVTADGVLGPLTLSAAKTYMPRVELVVRYLSGRLAFYDWLATNDPEKNGGSLLGWRRRLYRLALEAGRWRGL